MGRWDFWEKCRSILTIVQIATFPWEPWRHAITQAVRFSGRSTLESVLGQQNNRGEFFLRETESVKGGALRRSYTPNLVPGDWIRGLPERCAASSSSSGRFLGFSTDAEMEQTQRRKSQRLGSSGRLSGRG